MNVVFLLSYCLSHNININNNNYTKINNTMRHKDQYNVLFIALLYNMIVKNGLGTGGVAYKI